MRKMSLKEMNRMYHLRDTVVLKRFVRKIIIEQLSISIDLDVFHMIMKNIYEMVN